MLFFKFFKDVFGNAYFHHAFLHKNQYDDLQKAMNCYQMAEKNQRKYKNPDLYYNRAMVHLYLENYTLAYNDLITTESIDQNLKAGEFAESVVNNNLNFLKQIKNQCGIKNKKLNQLLVTIPINTNTNSGYELIDVENNVGSNNKKMISAKVIEIITKNVDIPISLICCDHKGIFFIASIYNLSKEFKEQVKPKISNIVIIDPIINKSNFTYTNKDYEYLLVKVVDLTKLLLNGKVCSHFITNSELSSTFFT